MAHRNNNFEVRLIAYRQETGSIKAQAIIHSVHNLNRCAKNIHCSFLNSLIKFRRKMSASKSFLNKLSIKKREKSRENQFHSTSNHINWFKIN